MNAGAAVTGHWAQQIVDAVDGRTNESGIRAALGAVGERFHVDAFAKVVEEEIVRSTMLGVLDVDWEVEHEDEIGLVKFAGKFPEVKSGGEPTVHAPFTEAIADFRNRNVMPRPAFDLLERDARRKAFTVARLAKQELLDTAHAELLRQIENSGKTTRKDPATGKWIYEGPNFREFKTFVRDRLESAGWTPANPSHVETVFRTNVMSAYAGGRHAQMSSPAVVARMPYWQIRGVGDSRQRPTHHAAVGILLPANHPFWKRAYPPFGYNCRCRVVARSQKWVDANSATIGPEPRDLPDPGFDSGTSALPAVPASLQAEAPTPAPDASPPLAPIATQSGPAFAPAAIPVRLPFDAPRAPAPVPLSPPPAPPRRPVDRSTFEQMGIRFPGDTDAQRDASHAAFQSEAQAIFGKTLDPQQVLRIAGVPHIPAKPAVTVSAAYGKLHVRASYFDSNLHQVATVVRKFTRGPQGAEVYHALFELDEKLQGKGTARAMLKDAFREYSSLGVKRVTLTAAWTGRYTWARMGFEYAGTAGEFQGIVRDFGKWLVSRGRKRVVVDKMLGSITSMNDLARFQVGKTQLGKTWLTGLPDGVMFPMRLELDPKNPSFHLAADYLGL